MNKLPEYDPMQKWFNRDHLGQDLKEKSVKGGLRTVGAQLFSFAINIVTTIFLARLLMPSDYGLVAMVTSFTGFILMFKDLGMAQAIIQMDGLNQRLVSMMFWFNFFVSLLLAFGIVVLGPLLVWFYDEPLLLGITFYYSLAAIFGGLSTQHQALLSRQMHFKELSEITIASSFFSLMPALWMAYTGYGYWALVTINVLNPGIAAVLLWFRCDWRPSWTGIDGSIKGFIEFGAGISGFNMINYFSRNLDNILIGRQIGSDALGLYAKAYQLLMLPITQLRDPLNTVATPALSSLHKEPGKYRHYYEQYLFLLAFFSMPIVAFLFITADDIILFLLGENWIEAAIIFKLLAITAFIQPTASTRGMVMISCGLSTRFFFWGLWNAVFVVIAFVTGIYLAGLNGLVIGYAIVNYIIFIPSLIYCFKGTPVRVADFFKTVAAPAIISILSAVALYWVVVQNLQLHLFLEIVLYAAVYAVLYLGLWFPVKAQRSRILWIIDIVKLLLKHKL